MKRMLICCLSAALLGPLCCHAQIRVNQVGMYPHLLLPNPYRQ